MKPSRTAGGGSILLLGIVLSGAVAFTAANSVEGSRIGEQLLAQGANDLKPPECDGITLTTIVTGTLIINGTDANELILGSPAIDIIDGGGGDDCILGGALDDTLIGGLGTDVCIGGDGNDTFDPTCETQIQ